MIVSGFKGKQQDSMEYESIQITSLICKLHNENPLEIIDVFT